MSLINEALKRTRDASYQPASARPAAAPGYRIQNDVEMRGSKGTLLVTGLIAVAVLAGVVVLGLRITPHLRSLKDGFNPDVDVTIANPAPALPTRPAGTPAPVHTEPTPTPSSTPATPAVDPKIAEDELVARLMEKIKAEQAATAAKSPLAEPPKLAIQGITYAADGREAMINGLTLREGDDIEGARITAIERRLVRLDFGGREIVLRLP